ERAGPVRTPGTTLRPGHRQRRHHCRGGPAMSVTAKSVLFAEADPASAAGSSPGWRGTLQRLGAPLAAASTAARETVERELSSVLGRLLDQELGQVIVAGLRHHPALHRAALATETDPAAVEVVQLAAHQITSSHHPYVDIVIDG